MCVFLTSPSAFIWGRVGGKSGGAIWQFDKRSTPLKCGVTIIRRWYERWWKSAKSNHYHTITMSYYLSFTQCGDVKQVQKTPPSLSRHAIHDAHDNANKRYLDSEKNLLLHRDRLTCLRCFFNCFNNAYRPQAICTRNQRLGLTANNIYKMIDLSLEWVLSCNRHARRRYRFPPIWSFILAPQC